METKLEDSVILSNILNALDISANKMATRLRYASPSSIYHILNGTNSISTDMANKIVDMYPRVNFLYVTRGEDPILLDGPEIRGQSNFFNDGRARFDDVPETLVEIKNLLQEILNRMKNKGKL